MTFNEISLKTDAVDVILSDGKTLETKLTEIDNHAHGLSDKELYLDLPQKANNASYSWSELMNVHCDTTQRKILKFIHCPSVTIGYGSNSEIFKGLVYLHKTNVFSYRTERHNYQNKVTASFGAGDLGALVELRITGNTEKIYDLDTMGSGSDNGLMNNDLALDLYNSSKTWKELFQSENFPNVNRTMCLMVSRNGQTSENWTIPYSTSLIIGTDASTALAISYGANPREYTRPIIKYSFGSKLSVFSTFSITGSNNKVYDLDNMDNLDFSCYMHPKTISDMSAIYPTQWNEILPEKEFSIKTVSRVQLSTSTEWAMGYSTGIIFKSLRTGTTNGDNKVSIFMSSHEANRGVMFASGSSDECKFTFKITGDHLGSYNLQEFENTKDKISQIQNDNLTYEIKVKDTPITNILTTDTVNKFSLNIFENTASSGTSTPDWALRQCSGILLGKTIKTGFLISETDTSTTTVQFMKYRNSTLSKFGLSGENNKTYNLNEIGRISELSNPTMVANLKDIPTFDDLIIGIYKSKPTFHILQHDSYLTHDWALKKSGGLLVGQSIKAGFQISMNDNQKQCVRFMVKDYYNDELFKFDLYGLNGNTYDLDNVDMGLNGKMHLVIPNENSDYTWKQLIGEFTSGDKNKGSIKCVAIDKATSSEKWMLSYSQSIMFYSSPYLYGIMMDSSKVRFFRKSSSTAINRYFDIEATDGKVYNLDSMDTGLNGSLYLNIQNTNADYTWKQFIGEFSAGSADRGSIKCVAINKATSSEKWMLGYSQSIMFYSSPYLYGIMMDSSKVRFFRKSGSVTNNTYFDIKASNEKVYDLDNMDTGLNGNLYLGVPNTDKQYTWTNLRTDLKTTTDRGALKVIDFGYATSGENWMLSYSGAIMFRPSTYIYGLMMKKNTVRFFTECTNSNSSNYFDIKGSYGVVYDLDAMKNNNNSNDNNASNNSGSNCYFEWLSNMNGSVTNKFVTTSGNRIRLTNAYDDYVLGVVSEGDSNGANVTLVGRAIVEHNGLCFPDDFCTAGEGGIAVPTDDREKGYRIIDRISSTLVEIVLK